MHGELGRAAAGARRGVAHGRVAADPQPRHDRRQPRHLLARRRRAAAAHRRRRRDRVRVGARLPPLPILEFVTGVKRNALEPDELITAVWVTPSGEPQTFMKVGPRNAMVIAVVSLCVSAGDELRASFGSASARPVLVTAPRGRGRSRSRSRSPPRPRRSTTCAARRATARTPCASSPAARSTGCSHEDLGARQRRGARGGLLGGRVAALRAAREARVPGREERVRAGRVRLVLGAARRDARVRLPRARRAGARARGDDGRGPRRRRAACTACRRRSSRRAPCSAASARPGSSSPPSTCWRGRRTRRTTRSARRSRATSAAARATRRSSTRCGSPRSA